MRTEQVIFTALVLLSSTVYLISTIPVTRWNDPAGYTYAGLHIAETGLPIYYDENNLRAGPYFTLHAFKVRSNPNSPDFYPNYSVGLPILIALIHVMIPIPQAELYLAPVMGVIGLVALFALGQKLFGKWVGLLAAALQAFNYVYWSQATENFSDVPATAFLLLGTLFSLHATKKDSLLFGLLGGATLGYACLIRYPSVLIIVPLSLYLLATIRGQSKPRYGLAGLLVSFAFFSLMILAYNATIFGGPFQTGYSSKHGWVPWPAFSGDYFLGRSPIQSGGYKAILSTLWDNFHLGLLLVPLGLLTMPRGKALLLGGSIVIVCGLYAFYVWPPAGLGARFLLFAFSMLYLVIAFAVTRIIGLIVQSKRSQLSLALVLLVALVWQLPSFPSSYQAIMSRNTQGKAVVSLVQELTRETESNAVFLSHTYNDMIILYGKRSSLYYAMLAQPDPATQSYRLAEYEPRLISVVDKLLETKTPVYVIKEPDELKLKQGPIDPYPILAKQFELVLIRDNPPLYKVLPLSTP